MLEGMDYPQMLLHICICFQCDKDPMEIPETIEVIGIILSFLLIDSMTCLHASAASPTS
jgi:hypothetical protein